MTPLYIPRLGREQVINNVHPESIGEMQEFLSSEDLAAHVMTGNITVAMIRPQVHESVITKGLNDAEAAELVESRVMGLGFVTKFSVMFDQEATEDFYGGTPKEVQLGLDPERYPNFANRWEEFSELMRSGNSSVILLHSTEGDAIERWRAQVGHYDVVNRRDPATIRGQLALDNYNNLIHGSDSIESVAREIDILSRLIERSVI